MSYSAKASHDKTGVLRLSESIGLYGVRITLSATKLLTSIGVLTTTAI